MENNKVQDAERGLFLSNQCANVLSRNNTFQNVRYEFLDEETERKAAEERVQKFFGRRAPVAMWSFDSTAAKTFVDSSGNGFHASVHGGVSVVPDGVRGQAARFDGTGYLEVDGADVFNAPEMTLALWLKPETVSGRRGLVAKRYTNSVAPFVLRVPA
ncbi:MAG: hypothetical protein ACC645_23170 [Pirellulales bacterium]